MARMLSLCLAALAAAGVAGAQELPARGRAQDFENQSPRFARAVAQRGAAVHEPFAPPVTAAKIRTAIDDAVKKMLDWLGPRKTNNTYVRGVRANVWEYALRKLPDDAKLKALLKEDF